MTPEKYIQIAERLKVLSNPKRLEILDTLSDHESSVGELVKALGLAKSNVSQHLMILRYLNFVTTKRVGRNIIYTIADKRVKEILKVFEK